MGNTSTALIFIVLLNVLMWMTQISITNLNPDMGATCFNPDNSILSGRSSGFAENDTLSEQGIDDIPSSTQGSVNPSQTNFVTDLFNSIIGFFKTVGKGIGYLVNLVNAPTNIINCAGLPRQISLGLGIMWNTLSLFFIISYFWWRD